MDQLNTSFTVHAVSLNRHEKWICLLKFTDCIDSLRLTLFLNDIGEVGEDSGDGGGSSVKELTICCSGLTGQPPEPKFDRNH